MGKKFWIVFGIFCAALGFVLEANAASLLTSAMTTALDDGFEALQDTYAAIIAQVWPYLLAILGLIAAPSIIKRIWRMIIGS
jgi:hypothetical protein